MFDSYAEVFELRACEYHSAMAEWARARDTEFRSVVAPLDDVPDGLVCDLPAGGGYLARYLRPGLRYVGVEPADGFCIAGDSSFDRVASDLGNIALPDRSVDHIVSLAGLHHEKDLRRVFGEMRRIIRPSGRVVISDAEAGTPPASFLNGFVARHNPQGHDGRFFDEGTRSLIEAAGLRIVEDALTEVPWSFDSRLDAGAFCKRLFWLPEVATEAVAEALDREIGFDEAAGQLRLKWALRRFICEAE